MLIENAEPINNEKLDELDAWYEQFTSNSFEMKFCDGDYWAMRKRLILAEQCIRDISVSGAWQKDSICEEYINKFKDNK